MKIAVFVNGSFYYLDKKIKRVYNSIYTESVQKNNVHFCVCKVMIDNMFLAMYNNGERK